MNTNELKKLAEAATPGPWHIRTNRHPNTDGTPWGWLDLYEAGSMRQASPDGVQVTWSRGRQSENNARYIAAANPAAILKLLAINAELVEALKNVTSGCEYSCLHGEWYWHKRTMPSIESLDAARAALAKAEGGEL
jgi:hypothetical protein